MTTITRFAPSPTGLLHLGHAYSALFAASEASGDGGHMLLRIEDIDGSRCRPEFETAISTDLAWLGLRWPTPVRRQSDHMADYAQALHVLQGRELVYPCFCTRKEIQTEIAASGNAPHGPDGALYPGTCRHLDAGESAARAAAGEAHALRLKTDEAARQTGALAWHDLDHGRVAARPEIFGDVVIARKDTPTSYHLAVTVDDHLQGVTRVTRGDDLFEATHVHRVLQGLLDYPTPEYRHHRLLSGVDGKRFAKRDKSVTLESLRQAGTSPAEVRALAGWEATA